MLKFITPLPTLLSVALPAQACILDTSASDTPRMPYQNWSTPIPSPEVWNDEQLASCASSVVIAEALSSTSRVKKADTPDPKRMSLIPHLEEEIDYQMKVVEVLRGPLKTGDTITTSVLPGEPELEHKPALNYQRLDARAFRVHFEKGKRYLIFNLPHPKSALELNRENEAWVKKVRATTQNPKAHAECQRLIARDQQAHAPIEPFAMGKLQCSITQRVVSSPEFSPYTDCTLECRDGARSVFQKHDACADSVHVSKDGKFALGLSGWRGHEYAFWLIDSEGATYAEVPMSAFPIQDYLENWRGIGSMDRKGGVREGRPRPTLTHFGPVAEVTSFWYDRLDPRVEFKKNGDQIEVSVRGPEGKTIPLHAKRRLAREPESFWKKSRWSNPTQRMQRLNSELTRAVKQGDLKKTSALLAQDANPNHANFLIEISEREKPSLELMRILLSSGANPNSKKASGEYPLSYAARYGHLEIAKLLIEAKSDLNIAQEWGWTPLMRAASQGHSEIVRLLLSSGADPALKDQDGKTAIDHARQSKSSETLRLIEGV